MKSTFLFCTKLKMFLSEIPLLIMLIISISYTNKVESLLGLWPLIIVISAFMIFIVIFFFRVITISNEEIRIHGVYSSKDSREIDEGKTLSFILKKKRIISVELWGIDKAPDFDWMDKNTVIDRESCLFKEKAVGGESSVKRVLEFFSIPDSDVDLFFGEGDYDKKYTNFHVSSTKENGERRVDIRFLKTL